jgi:hypothetical protein
LITIRTVNVTANAWLGRSERPRDELAMNVDLTLEVDRVTAADLEVRLAARTAIATLITIDAADLAVAAVVTLEADHIIAPAPSRKNVVLT